MCKTTVLNKKMFNDFFFKYMICNKWDFIFLDWVLTDYVFKSVNFYLCTCNRL